MKRLFAVLFAVCFFGCGTPDAEASPPVYEEVYLLEVEGLVFDSMPATEYLQEVPPDAPASLVEVEGVMVPVIIYRAVYVEYVDFVSISLVAGSTDPADQAIVLILVSELIGYELLDCGCEEDQAP